LYVIVQLALTYACISLTETSDFIKLIRA